MSKLALYQKYRSSTFEEVVGQEYIVRSIKNAVRTGKSWISGKLNDIARISVACGFSETLYDKVPNYIESSSDIR